MSLSSEQWRPVPGYERTYEVSDQGRVYSHPRPSTRGGILKPIVGRDGYQRVGLRQDGQRARDFVHHLVLSAFVGPRPPGMYTRHLNGQRTDNRLTNLAYGTCSENLYDKVRHGTDHNARKTHCKYGHPYDEANTYRYGRERHCRACQRARNDANSARRRGLPFDFQAMADARYARIVSDGTTA